MGLDKLPKPYDPQRPIEVDSTLCSHGLSKDEGDKALRGSVQHTVSLSCVQHT